MSDACDAAVGEPPGFPKDPAVDANNETPQSVGMETTDAPSSGGPNSVGDGGSSVNGDTVPSIDQGSTPVSEEDEGKETSPEGGKVSDGTMPVADEDAAEINPSAVSDAQSGDEDLDLISPVGSPKEAAGGTSEVDQMLDENDTNTNETPSQEEDVVDSAMDDSCLDEGDDESGEVLPADDSQNDEAVLESAEGTCDETFLGEAEPEEKPEEAAETATESQPKKASVDEAVDPFVEKEDSDNVDLETPTAKPTEENDSEENMIKGEGEAETCSPPDAEQEEGVGSITPIADEGTDMVEPDEQMAEDSVEAREPTDVVKEPEMQDDVPAAEPSGDIAAEPEAESAEESTEVATETNPEQVPQDKSEEEDMDTSVGVQDGETESEAADSKGEESVGRTTDTVNAEDIIAAIDDFEHGKDETSDMRIEVASLNESMETEAGDTANKDTEAGETANKDTEAGETSNKDTEAGETSNKDTEAGETANKDTEAGETANKDTEVGETSNKDTEAVETANKDTKSSDDQTNEHDVPSSAIETPMEVSDTTTEDAKPIDKSETRKSSTSLPAAKEKPEKSVSSVANSAPEERRRDTAITAAASSSKEAKKAKETEKTPILPASKIKKEPKEPDENMQGVAADMVNEFLGIMGMDKLAKEEKDKLNVGSKFNAEPTGTNVKKEATSSPAKTSEKEKEKSAKSESRSPQMCIVCRKVSKCKYNIVRNGDVKHLCDDLCFKKFRTNPVQFLRDLSKTGESAASKKAKAADTSPPVAPVVNAAPVPRACTECKKQNGLEITWHGLDFCSVNCLGLCQSKLGTNCGFCSQSISQASMAKFCTNTGNEIRQFCQSSCLEEYRKHVKLCSFCFRDLSTLPHDSFMAPVGNKGEFHDFCTQVCMKKFEEASNESVKLPDDASPGRRTRLQASNVHCAVCGTLSPSKHEIKYKGTRSKVCGTKCLIKFQVTNKVTGAIACESCGTYFENCLSPRNELNFEGSTHVFCTASCLNTYREKHSKAVTCLWCKTKKNNFDMVQSINNNVVQHFCTLKCLSMHRVKIQATSNQLVACDHCGRNAPAQYHLTMSDASVRNFCCYPCVMTFQSQFQGGTSKKSSLAPSLSTVQRQQAPAQQGAYKAMPSLTKRPQVSVNHRTAQYATPQSNQNTNSLPQIANVMSLAPSPSQTNRVAKAAAIQASKSAGTQSTNKSAPKFSMPQTIVQKEVIIQHPPPKQVKNKSLLCKPFNQTKATSCRPHTQMKETQTEGEVEKKPVLIPVPVPIYIPVPMAMYSLPTPFPFPIPIPIPVPCFIPTTKKSADSILKHVKEIQERLPSDPFEAELLMMAEAVATADKGSDAESSDDSDKEDLPKSGLPSAMDSYSGTPPQETLNPESNTFGEDMLQMALRMASEMTEPVMDLEDALAPVPINQNVGEFSTIEPDNGVLTASAPKRGKKRGGKAKGGRTKRQRAQSPPPAPTAVVPAETTPPPDANMHLKYTYGVNAWKHWVTLKNQQLTEASNGRSKLKLFKSDILACSSDELNFSLCLFVKEVRKPNGTDYAPDSIYYLCLGIQQYLFENGRIDNIFTDFYYEKFTECLNEVIGKYEARLNHQGILVCRIEEEHLWESKQLGAHSPHVLLNTLVYFNTRHFFLRSSESHLKLSFTQIMKQWKKTGHPNSKNQGRSVFLRYYVPTMTETKKGGRRKEPEESNCLEQCENLDNPLRCPVKLYEFYMSKCPESIKNRSDVFYLVPERSCVPDSPVWYSTQALGMDAMSKMMNRLRTVREIQESFLTNPTFE